MSWIGNFQRKLSVLWRAMKNSSRFHSFLVFLIFVVIAAVFWFVLALNDSVQKSFVVRIQISNTPDSVTFISDVPKEMHAAVRDRGSALIRSALIKEPMLSLNFRDYGVDGKFRVSKADLTAQLKGVFGSSATIVSSSLDSLNLVYTTNKGKRLPVTVVSDVTPAAGMVIQGEPHPQPVSVMVYGSGSVLDTLTHVYTDLIVKRELSERKTYDVPLARIKGARIEPSSVKVEVNVEPLVSKTEVLPIQVIGVPGGESLLLFPAQVTAEYFVPMSRFSSEKDPAMRAEVEYSEAVRSLTGKVHVSLVVSGNHILNPHLTTDSVEYTIVR